MPFDNERAAKELEQRTEALRSLLGFAQRAFVIEFAGTPKSGKSTAVEAVRHFFTRQGFRVHVLTERAAMCPIPMKGHLFFNTWCAASMLAELLANVETETDLIIVDRGLFDALVWLTLQAQRGELTQAEAHVIESFLLLDRWRTLVDLVVVMNVSAEEAIARETAQRITSKPGSIMNPAVLQVLSESVRNTVNKYGTRFGHVILHETAGEGVRESNIMLATKIVDALQEFLDPEILVVPRSVLEELPLENGGSFTKEAMDRAVKSISESARYERRSQAEVDDRNVQVISAGMLTYRDQVFIFQRKEHDPKYRLYGKTTVFQAAHVARKGERDILQLLKGTLQDRVMRSLFLSRMFEVSPVGYCWDKDDPNSGRHFGIIYRVDIDNEHTALDLKRKELRKQRGPSLAGEFLAWKHLAERKEELRLEPWSLAALHGLQDIRGLKAVL